MLQSLSIRNFVLIDELTIDFQPHFSVITGETGAGKSIILGAIGLLMGQRADSSTLRPGADRCIIEARFTHLDAAVGIMLEEEDIDSDEEECIVRREITSKGKSRAFINDTPASLQLLKRLSEYLIDIHSQHKNLLLGDAGFQLSVLDLYSGSLPQLHTYQEAYRRLREGQRAYEEAKATALVLSKEQDYLQFQYDQLEEAEIEEGELEALEEEERQLSHAQEIREELGGAVSALEDDERGALQSVHLALRSVESIRRYHSSAEEWCERLSSVRIELQDLASTLSSEAEEVTFSPKRLARVEARLDQLRGLLHKHGLESCSQLIALKEELAERLEKINSSDEDLARLAEEVEAAEAEVLRLGEALRQIRSDAARAIETALVLALLKTLGLDALPDAGTLILYWVSTYAVCLLMATLVQALCFGAHGQFVPLVFGVALSFLGLFSLYLPTALAHLVPSSYFGLLSTVGMNYDQGLGQMSFYMRAWSVPDFLIVVALSAVSYVLSCRAFVRKEL